jgi:hypothetical protein
MLKFWRVNLYESDHMEDGEKEESLELAIYFVQYRAFVTDLSSYATREFVSEFRHILHSRVC